MAGLTGCEGIRLQQVGPVRAVGHQRIRRETLSDHLRPRQARRSEDGFAVLASTAECVLDAL